VIRRGTIVLAVALALTGTIWAETPDEIYREAATKFHSLYGGGRYPDALVQAKIALQAAPRREDPYIWVSKLSTQLAQDDAAIRLFGELASKNPKMTWPWYYKGFNEFHISRFEDAVESFTRATTADPRHAPSFHRLGMIRVIQGKFPEARTTFERAFTLDPTSQDTAAELADVQRITGDYAAANRTAEVALRHHPKSARLQMIRGRLLTRDADITKAEPFLRRAIELDPKQREAHQELARLLMRTDRREEGRRHLTIAKRLKDYESYERGIKRLTARVATSRDAGLPMLLAEVELTRGGYSEALGWFQRAQQLGLANTRVASGIAEAAFRAGNVELGERALRPIAKSSSGRVDLARAARALVGGDHDAAIAHTRKAIERGPIEREFLRRCASTLEAAGQIDEAEKLFATAKNSPELSSNPDRRP